MSAPDTNKTYYKWYVLILGTLILALLAGAERMCLPPLFPEITESLGMSMTQMMTVWGMDPLAGVFVSLGAGLLIDRFGVKRTLTAVCFLAGVTGALRGLSFNFFSMAATMFIFGLLVAMLPTLVPKAIAIWFLGQRLAMANGVLGFGMTGGAMLGTMLSATILSPFFGGWRFVLLAYSIPPILLSFIWFATVTEPPAKTLRSRKTSEVPFREAFSHVIRIKELWIIGIILMGAGGAFNSITGYLPSYLGEIGWDTAAADSALTLIIATNALTSVPMGLISDGFGSRKAVLVPSLFLVSITMGAIPFFKSSTLVVWVLIASNGLLRGGMYPLLTALVTEQKGVGSRYAGTAIGLVYSLEMLGCAISAPMGAAVAEIFGGGAALLTWAAISLIVLAGFPFVPETPLKKSRSVGEPTRAYTMNH